MLVVGLAADENCSRAIYRPRPPLENLCSGAGADPKWRQLQGPSSKTEHRVNEVS